jgi:endonuclease G
MQIPSLFKESRYGMPTADQILPNRQYVIGYSYLFRQPRFAMHVIHPEDIDSEVDREDAFRTDYRIPEQFQVELKDYRSSGYDRGHLVPSADRSESRVENSETFLLSNMAPQTPELNRNIWKNLEASARKIAGQIGVVEVYSISGPCFQWGQPLERIGTDVVIPHAFFKCLLIERSRGTLQMKSWVLPNTHDVDEYDINEYKVSVRDVEAITGLLIWDRLDGSKIESMKKRK